MVSNSHHSQFAIRMVKPLRGPAGRKNPNKVSK